MTYMKPSKYIENILVPHVATCLNHSDSLLSRALVDLDHMKILGIDGIKSNSMKIGSYNLY